MAMHYIGFACRCVFSNNQAEKHEIKEMMRDAVLHDVNKISLFGITDVNPGFISAMVITAIMLVAATLIRIFVIPKFEYIPISKFQILLEEIVGLFDDFAQNNSPHRNKFLGAYIFGAGMYIFLEPYLNSLVYKALLQWDTLLPFRHLCRILMEQ